MKAKNFIKKYNQGNANELNNNNIDESEETKNALKILAKIIVKKYIVDKKRSLKTGELQKMKKIKVFIDGKINEFQVEEEDVKTLLKVIRAFSK